LEEFKEHTQIKLSLTELIYV